MSAPEFTPEGFKLAREFAKAGVAQDDAMRIAVAVLLLGKVNRREFQKACSKVEASKDWAPLTKVLFNKIRALVETVTPTVNAL